MAFFFFFCSFLAQLRIAAPTTARAFDGSTSAVLSAGFAEQFGSQTVVDAIDLDVPTGAVYGFLGPNGSGKTTTIRMLLGLVRPTGGEIQLLGAPMPGRRGGGPAPGGVARGGSGIPPLPLRAAEPGAAGLRRPVRRPPTPPPTGSTLRSTGSDCSPPPPSATAPTRWACARRLAIAAALLAPRDLLILDEPTNGLDPQGTREVRHLVASLAGDGATVLVSSHLLSEVEQMCSHVGVMREGRLVAQGTVGEVRAAGAAAVVEVTTEQSELAAQTLRGLGLTGVVTTGTGASAPPGDVPPEQIVAALVAAGVGVRGFAVQAPSLEDLFVSLTGEGFDVSG